MSRDKLLKTVQSALCIAFALLLVIGAVRIYRDGAARRAAEPETQIFTPELAAQYAAPALVVLAASAAVTALCATLGVGNDEKTAKKVENGMAWKKNVTETGSKLPRLLIIALAAAFIVAGVVNGSARDVLIKAINICTECVGLG